MHAQESVLLVGPPAGARPGGISAQPDRPRTPPAGQTGDAGQRVLHTLYISPLKALAVDVARNLEDAVAEMGLPVRIERAPATPLPRSASAEDAARPDILLTTPEQLALLIASREAPRLFFENLKTRVLDELHALYNSKRGDLLALGLASCALSRRDIEASDCRRRLPIPIPCSLHGRRGIGARTRGRSACKFRSWIPKRMCPGLTHRALCHGRCAGGDQAAKTSLVLRQHARQCGAHFSEPGASPGQRAIALHHGSLAPAQRRKVETP